LYNFPSFPKMLIPHHTFSFHIYACNISYYTIGWIEYGLFIESQIAWG
jgi:hypothetical protein